MKFLVRDNKEKIFFYDLNVQENLVIAQIDGVEFFRVSFIPENFIENFKLCYVPQEPNEGIYNLIRWRNEQHGLEKTEEEIKEDAWKLKEDIFKIVADAKIRNIAECFTNNLHQLVAAILDDAIKAFTIYGSVELFEEAGEKFPVEEIKKIILKTYWSRIAELAGIKRGGYKGQKGFWDDKKKIEFCKIVDNLPKVKGAKLWKYIFDELVFVDFDLETQIWLKQRPELKVIPDSLFAEAIEKWRKYNSVREIKDNNEKLRFFEYRLALHLLEFPDEFEFSSLDTYYKRGKSLIKKGDIQSGDLSISKKEKKSKKTKLMLEINQLE